MATPNNWWSSLASILGSGVGSGLGPASTSSYNSYTSQMQAAQAHISNQYAQQVSNMAMNQLGGHSHAYMPSIEEQYRILLRVYLAFGRDEFPTASAGLDGMEREVLNRRGWLRISTEIDPDTTQYVTLYQLTVRAKNDIEEWLANRKNSIY
jgi:hypothetical protein